MTMMGSWAKCRCCDGTGRHVETFEKRKPDGRYREYHDCTCNYGMVPTEPLLGFPDKSVAEGEYLRAQEGYIDNQKCPWYGYPDSW